ncbi:zeta-sarcoglycan isoform X2 [Labeo rohita]|uniref:zeta-sarcoglycan isoform X2 n=1 Tax=Labeo rohita TaxID=84645 RepID=UPI0021E336F0|nr:zeta-sarcoglycan isoform X2 [Labeo rohita]
MCYCVPGGDLRLAKALSLFLHPPPPRHHDRQPSLDHMDSKGHELHRGWHGKSPRNQRGHQIRGGVGVPPSTLCERDQIQTGSEMVEAQCQRFEVRSSDGERVLFSADEDEISIGTDKLRVTGNEGVVFSHSVETPHVRAEPFQDLKLESPTRTLTLEAPKGVEVNAGVGEFKASCRKDLTLESSEGEIFLNANSIRLGNLPHGSVDPLLGPGTTYPKQTVYEVCVCPSGKLYLSPAESSSTCQTTNSVCLWS